MLVKQSLWKASFQAALGAVFGACLLLLCECSFRSITAQYLVGDHLKVQSVEISAVFNKHTCMCALS